MLKINASVIEYLKTSNTELSIQSFKTFLLNNEYPYALMIFCTFYDCIISLINVVLHCAFLILIFLCK